MTKTHTTVMCCAAAAALACGGSLPPPTLQLTNAKAEVSKAEGVEAEKVPQAKLYLSMAKDHISTAEQLIAREEMEEADLVLVQARADAELAYSLTREAELKEEVEQATVEVAKHRAAAQEETQKEAAPQSTTPEEAGK